MTFEAKRAQSVSLDQHDPLKGFRDRFILDPSIVYLDGNSLGPMVKTMPERMMKTLQEEWAQGLIRSWNDAGWIDLPNRVAAKIAGLIGAERRSVTVADSTSINLYKVLAAALMANPGRCEILSEKGNFPTDLYVAEGLSTLMGKGHRLVLVDSHKQITDSISDQCAVVMLTHVDFRTGRLLDMAAITKVAHAAGALVIWDLAHSAGALPVHLDRCNVDFAVGCGYKYLNGGPGAPSFVYVNPRHLGKVHQPLTGWFSHKSPFAFDGTYMPSPSIDQFQCGTPPILSLTGLDEALQIWDAVEIEDVREKSLKLSDFFLECLVAIGIENRVSPITPIDHCQRGSQISLRFDGDGYAVIQALIERGVIGDYRDPGILRFGFAPLYVSYTDVLRAVEGLAAVLESGVWKEARYSKRKSVT